jgi:glycolate oxidase FAD binding subunit
MRLATEHELAVVPRGAGTKLDWGAAPSHVDLLLDTGRLAGVWHHSPAERVAEIGAGTPVRAAQARLGRSGQRMALDPASADATLGGVIAADEAGPLAQRYGAPCTQVLGVSYVRVDGALAHSGGQARERTADAGAATLLCGAYGTLGVMASLTVRLQALPATRVWVCRSVWSPLEVHDLVREVMSAGVDPAAVEFDLPAAAGLPAGPVAGRGAGTVGVLLEGGTAAVEEEAVIVQSLLGGRAVRSATPPSWWRRYPFGPDDVALRLMASPADLHAAVYALRDAAGVAVPVRGSGGLGVVHAGLPGSLPPGRIAEIIEAVRGVLLRRRGRCVVLAAPAHVRAEVQLWASLVHQPLQRQVKERFDPAGRLSPGRPVGGL